VAKQRLNLSKHDDSALFDGRSTFGGFHGFSQAGKALPCLYRAQSSGLKHPACWSTVEIAKQKTSNMTNQQLYMAIGAPMLFNAILITLLWMAMNAKFGAVQTQFASINQRFDDMRDLWRAELHRVEEVIDARLKHLEEKR
jgi:hypothetical protein